MPVSIVGGPVTYAQPISTIARAPAPVTYAQPTVTYAREEFIEIAQPAQPITYAAPRVVEVPQVVQPVVQRPRDLIGNYGVVYERNITRDELLQQGRLTADPAREEQLMLQAAQKAGYVETHLAFQDREMLEMQMIEYAAPPVRTIREEFVEIEQPQVITYQAPQQVMEVVQQPAITYGAPVMTTAAPMMYVTAAQPQFMSMQYR
eukprot:TRINITY_DN1477_c0_g1_i1.p1 TRINITY_DN1477_c0_g1~~TRINITY_DN1477_c0_g1_i1.p1  ORF type:complete len:241 (+),score=47.86 TRINITY_DN1477_c0_g1_i1:109-723(+)